MMHNPKADLDLIYRDQFEPVFAKTKSCACGQASSNRSHDLCLADKSSVSGQSDEGNDAGYNQLEEDEILEQAIRLLESTGLANNLPASMRLIEYIAETAGYRRARQSASTKVTELMLMAARASTLADDFRRDL